MLEHGGNLCNAIRQFGHSRKHWLDLSTGINPQGYPVPMLPIDAWHRLPEATTALVSAAAGYYDTELLLPVAGTQAAIQALPQLRRSSRVVVAAPSYAEHAHHWQRHGHQMRQVPYDDLDTAVEESDVVVVCNPNNPTGATVASEHLLDWTDALAARGGWLIVDEAFIDATPHNSIVPFAGGTGLIVLRSIGKFFGLAGLRLGFVAAPHDLLATLADMVGPWTVSGPAQLIGCAALRDTVWQNATRNRLLTDGKRLRRLLAAHGIASSGSAMFQWWPETRAEAFWRHMAECAIWVRLFPQAAYGIRIGLPPDENGWRRLAQALEQGSKASK